MPVGSRSSAHPTPNRPASDSGGTGVACPKSFLSLSNLPLAEEGADRSLWPYLEVQVLLTEPDPGFRHRVEEALADKAVRLTSIISYPKKEGEEDSRPFSYTDLQKMLRWICFAIPLRTVSGEICRKSWKRCLTM